MPFTLYDENLYGLTAPATVTPPWYPDPISGTQHVSVVYQHEFWDGAVEANRTYANLDFSASGVLQTLGATYESAGYFTSLDIEKWGPNDTVEPTNEATQISHYSDIIDSFKVNYTGTLGLYQFPIFLEQSTFLAGNASAGWTTWKTSNDAWFTAIGAKINVFQPVFYVRDSSALWENGIWEAFMIANIDECARLDNTKPIIPYIGIEYSSFASASGPIPGKQMLHIQRFVYENCGGEVIWGGYQTDWDNTHPVDGSMDWYFDGVRPFLDNPSSTL